MKADDAADVAGLSRELGYPADAEQIRGRIGSMNASDLLLIAAGGNGRAVAFIHAHLSCAIEVGPRVEILGLVVSAKAKRNGIGRILLAEVEEWSRDLGVDAVVVRSNTARTESHAFYPAVGYKLKKTQAVYEKKLRD